MRNSQRLAMFAATMFLGIAEAQAQGIGVVPDGEFLGVTPVVSADRRYVRLSVNPNFSSVTGFTSFPVPAAVSGGGAVGFGAGPAGINGVEVAGMPRNRVVPGNVDPGYAPSAFGASFDEFLNAAEPAPAPRVRASRRSVRGRATSRR